MISVATAISSLLFCQVLKAPEKAAERPVPRSAAQPVRGLSPQNVLVVYDSRKPESLAVAAHYAGSGAVSGSLAKVPGTRPGVRVLDLAGLLGDTPLPNGTVDYDQFQKLLRQPLIEHLSKVEYAAEIRVLVLTKGIPHRIADMKAVQTGDQPQLQGIAFEGGNATCASVDSELTLLWQDLRSGEKGGKGDSFADGLIMNPYWRRLGPFTQFPNTHIRVAKKLLPIVPGQFWRSEAASADPAVDSSSSLSPGDMLLVCRLDGHTVAEVTASLDRAVRANVDPNNASIILDESDSNGIPDTKPNRELDNMGPEFLWIGDDYELSRDVLLADGRFRKDNIYYDFRGGEEGFCIGPRLDCKGKGKLVSGKVLFLASAGGNAAGSRLMLADGRDSSSVYPESFQYAPGAVFTSIESFNGRDFGSTGGWPGQAQAANFLAAGGTFAICNAWEPFAFSLPDNVMIVTNFVLGNLCWAEAAYSSIPALSWQQVVLGDPLARLFRICEDINRDNAIDAADMRLFDQIAANKSEDGRPIGPELVARADINRDGVVDGKDRALVERDIAANDFYAPRPGVP